MLLVLTNFTFHTVMHIYILVSFFASAVVALILLPWLLTLCHRYRLYDLPDERKIHKSGIPRLGGVVFVPAMLTGMVAGIATIGYYDGTIPETIHTSSVIVGAGVFLLYFIGILDDLIGVTAWIKFVVQFVVAVSFPLCGLYIDSLYGFLGIYELPIIVSYVLTVFITLLIINAINLIDGIDGLATGISLIALAVYAVIFNRLGTIPFVLICSSLGGVLVIFLFYNLWGDAEMHRKTFMGDSGSLLLGVVLSYFTMKYAMSSTPTLPYRADGLLVAYTTLLVPCFDLCRVALCRIRRHRGIFDADKTHLHHKFMAAGFTMSQALFAILVMQLGFMFFNYTLFILCVAMEWIVAADVFIFAIINVVLPVDADIAGVRREYAYHHADVQVAEMDYQGEEGLVSVIMPTYNAARFVADSIESIIAQTYTNWELIITDDKSSDGTIEILRHYAARDSRIIVLENAVNSGAGFSRNASIAKARGQYIAFCDSDDRWMPAKLERQVQFMKEKDVKICFAPYYTCNELSEYLGYVPAPRHVNLFSTMCDDKIGFLTCIYDANQCGKHYMPLQRKRQDYAFLLNLMRTCPHAYSVQEPLGHYRLHQNNISGNKISLIKYNALAYRVVFDWPKSLSYVFLFTFFMPTYFWKRIKNILVNISRTQLG